MTMDARRFLSDLACPLIPVVVIDRLDDAVPVAEALLGGGIAAIEVTLRTPVGCDAITEMKSAFPDAVIGAGTVCSEDAYYKAADSGVDFIVSPGATDGLFQAASRFDLPFLPGAVTGSEVLMAMDYGYHMLKFFPAEAAGGVPTAVAAGDLNGDGQPEIGAALFTGDGLAIWSFTDRKTLAPIELAPAGSGYRGLAMGDVTGDGVVDVVMAHPMLNVLTIYPGQGDLTLAAPITTQVTGSPRAVLLHDMTGDGTLEIVVVREIRGVQVYDAETDRPVNAVHGLWCTLQALKGPLDDAISH